MKYFYIYCFVFFFASNVFSTEADYIGASLGTNFYSTLDQGRYSIRTNILKKRLSEWSDGNHFIADCALGGEKVFREGAMISLDDLDALSEGDFEKVHEKINPEFLGKGYTTELAMGVAKCMIQKRDAIATDTDKTIKNIEKIAMIGLYMDGSTENSDYDIISDINTINQIIFETPIPYEGSNHLGKFTFSDILKGNTQSLFSYTGETITGSTHSGSSGSQNSLPEGYLDNGALCVSSGSIDIRGDEGLMKDIYNTLKGNETQRTASGGKYMNASGSRSGNNPSDFSHTFPCDGIFCITIDFVPANTSLLTGGTPMSIEGILKKNLEYLENANATSLTAKYMTNNFFGFTFPSLNLPSMANIVVITTQKPQPFLSLAKNVKRDDEVAFEEDFRCARLEAGLEEDVMRMNDFTKIEYMREAGLDHLQELTSDETRGHTTVHIRHPLSECTTAGIMRGNADTYEGLSRDLTEIQVFTESITSGLNATIPGFLKKLLSTPQI